MKFCRLALLALSKCADAATQASVWDPYDLDIFDQQRSLNPSAPSFTPSPPIEAVNNDGGKKRCRRKSRAQKNASNKARGQDDFEKSEYIKVYSQNVHGIWESEKDEEGNPVKDEDGKVFRSHVKRDYIVNHMKREEIDIYLIQETWDEGNKTTDVGDGYIMFKHNIGFEAKNDRSSGVAIIVSPRVADWWKAAGGLDAIHCKKFIGRFIGITLKIPEYDSRGKKIAKRWQHLFIASVYHPYDEKYKDFNCELDDILNNLDSKYKVVMGGDMNAQVGMRRDDDFDDVLGPYGLPHRNEKGKDLLQVYQSNGLCIMNTYFESPNYVTHKSFNIQESETMLDMIATSRHLTNKVSSCKTVNDGVRSDHSAVCLMLEKISIKHTGTKYTAVSAGELNKNKIQYDEECNKDFNDHFEKRWDNDTSYEDFCTFMMEAARATSSSPVSTNKVWFDYNKDVLMDSIGIRDTKLSWLRINKKHLTPEVIEDKKQELREMQKHIYDNTRIAMERWAEHHANKIHDMAFNPRAAWQSIHTLSGGDSSHVKNTKNMALRKDDGTLAQNDAENATILGPHFTRVFNNKRDVDWSVLSEIEQRAIMHELDAFITWIEFEEALNGVMNNKAPGENGVPPDVIKALKGANRERLLHWINEFWEGNQDYESWHSGLLTVIHKAGKPKDNPNNYRGVNLMDVISKVMSRILNKRLFKILDKHGTKYQFGGTPEVGCREGTFTLKTLLHTRRNHNLGTHVAFIDLVKAYDTANHELLIKVLEKYGAPPKLCNVITRLYTDLKVVLKIGKEKIEINQGVGVRQGDNMAPVLFLFLMSVVADLIDIKWEEESIERVSLVRESDETYRSGQIFRHDIKKCMRSDSLVSVYVDYTIYVDDKALPFASREQMCKGLPLVEAIFKRLGMEMHVGSLTEELNDETGMTEEVMTESKTECVFYPPPGFFKRHALAAGGFSDFQMQSLDESDDESDEKKETRASIEDRLYDACNETQIVHMIGNGIVTYCKHFKYLGSWVSYNLRDDHDIDMRIASASKSMGALKIFFHRAEVSLRAKYLVFMAIPINLLLWGCESWALRKDLLNKLERFVRRKIRGILKLNMWHIKEQRITIEQLQERFHNIPTVQTLVDVRTMQFLGKVVRGHVSLPPRQLLIAFIPNTRAHGRPLKCNRESMWECLKRLFKDVNGIHIDSFGSLKDWYLDALDKKFWNDCIEHLRNPEKPVPERPNPRASFNPRRSSRNRQQSNSRTNHNDQSHNHNNQSQQENRRENRRRQHGRREGQPNVSPPRRGNNRPRGGRRPIDDQQAREYLMLFDLGIGATYAEVKAQYRSRALRLHPDKHNSDRTGLSNEEAEELFKLYNNAHSYLKTKLANN